MLSILDHIAPMHVEDGEVYLVIMPMRVVESVESQPVKTSEQSAHSEPGMQTAS